MQNGTSHTNKLGACSICGQACCNCDLCVATKGRTGVCSVCLRNEKASRQAAAAKAGAQ